MSGTPADQPVIEITVNTDGSTNVRTSGFAGSSCREATAFLEKALGIVTDERLTSEFYQLESEPVRQRESA